jgi:hypothetical protein
MKRSIRLVCTAALVALVVATATASFAQVVARDAYQLNYFSGNVPDAANEGAGSDAAVRIINTGQNGSPLSTNQGTVCASIYVFDANQEMLACCSCAITANGLLTLDIGDQLVENTLTTVEPETGVIKVVADVKTRCDATSIVSPIEGALRSFGVHLQTGGAATETLFQTAPLTNTEQAFLGNACSFVVYLGSGKGTCSCRPEPAVA